MSLQIQAQLYKSLFDTIRLFGQKYGSTNDKPIIEYMLEKMNSNETAECGLIQNRTIIEALLVLLNTLLHDIQNLKRDKCGMKIINNYNEEIILQLSSTIKKYDPSFNVEDFLSKKDDHIEHLIEIIDDEDVDKDEGHPFKKSKQ